MPANCWRGESALPLDVRCRALGPGPRQGRSTHDRDFRKFDFLWVIDPLA
jgi:hypothetical protein